MCPKIIDCFLCLDKFVLNPRSFAIDILIFVAFRFSSVFIVVINCVASV